MKSVEGSTEYKLTTPYELVVPFKQWVNEHGYFIKKYVRIWPKEGKSYSDRKPDLAIAVDETSANDQYAYSSFEPLNDLPGLMFRFSELGVSPSQGEIISFANEYGLLGVDEEGYLYIEGESPRKPKTGIDVEFLEDWYSALKKICPVVQLWRALQNEDQEFLETHIVRNENAVSFRYLVDDQNLGGAILHKSRERDKQKFLKLGPNDRVTPAKMYIVRSINAGLKDRCRPSILYQDQTYTKAEIGVSCLNLLGAMWLQFAKVVQGERKVLRCLNCSQFFVVAEKRRGSPQKYCRPSCRFKAFSLREKT